MPLDWITYNIYFCYFINQNWHFIHEGKCIKEEVKHGVVEAKQNCQWGWLAGIISIIIMNILWWKFIHESTWWLLREFIFYFVDNIHFMEKIFGTLCDKRGGNSGIKRDFIYENWHRFCNYYWSWVKSFMLNFAITIFTYFIQHWLCIVLVTITLPYSVYHKIEKLKIIL